MLELPFGIFVPEGVSIPKRIPLQNGRFLPKKIALPAGFVLPETVFKGEEVPVQSLLAISHPRQVDAVSVKIFPQFLERDEQYVEFKISPDMDTSLLIGDCLLPTNTLPHGPCEDWEFEKSVSDRVKLHVPVALYQEFILPYYFQDFWLGLSTHLEYLDTENWWVTW